MRREITWVEKLPDRIKREVRVQFHGGRIFWRDRHSAGRQKEVPAEEWNDHVTPSEEDWERLLDEVRRRFQRGKAQKEEVEMVLNRAIGTKRGAPSQRLGKEI